MNRVSLKKLRSTACPSLEPFLSSSKPGIAESPSPEGRLTRVSAGCLLAHQSRTSNLDFLLPVIFGVPALLFTCLVESLDDAGTNSTPCPVPLAFSFCTLSWLLLNWPRKAHSGNPFGSHRSLGSVVAYCTVPSFPSSKPGSIPTKPNSLSISAGFLSAAD